MGLLDDASVVIDGSKFKAVNNRDRSFTRAKMERRLQQIEESVARYLQHWIAFGTIKARMGATHFLMKTLPRVAAEMALHVLAYNLTRVMNIMGAQPLMAAMRA
jgi:hypothetical protein